MGKINTLDPIQRFSSRVKYYVKYRPGYPEELVDFLEKELQVTPDFIVADIGSGTGLLSELFLKHGNPVFGVEPNEQMRKAAEKLLKQYPLFHSVNGTAESTTLESSSVDFVTTAQAFHWFDREQFKQECIRILKPGGWVILLWNVRRTADFPFLKAYENILSAYCRDNKPVEYTKILTSAVFEAFFGWYQSKTFLHSQKLDPAGLLGKFLSNSSSPLPGDVRYKQMVKELEGLFKTYQSDGFVTLHYRTEIYFGQLKQAEIRR